MKKRFEELVELINGGNLNTVIEIGVGNGMTADYILSNTPLKVTYFGIDPYLPYDKQDVNSKPSRLRSNLYDLQKIKVKHGERLDFIMESSEVAVHTVEDERADLIFIDGNHQYDHVRMDIELWWPKLKVGGLMAFHDYNRYVMFPGVKKAIDEFTVDNDKILYKLSDIVFVSKDK